MNRFSLLLATAVLVTTVEVSVAQVPRMLSYQGVLTDTLGNPKPDGLYSLTFRLFESASGGTAIWSETKNLTVRRGLFFTALGDQTSFGGAVQFDRPYWLGIQVGGGPELSPRAPLTSVAYSMRATKADTARYALSAAVPTYVDSARIAGTIPDNTVTSPKILNGAVATVDLADNAVATAKIQDAAVTQSKLAPGVSLPPGGAAGGDLTGTYPNPTITSNAVTAPKLADNAVTSPKILDGTIASADIADNAIVTAKIAPAAITTPKINPSGATSGQALTYNGVNVVWGNPLGSLALPYQGSVSAGGSGQSAFRVENTATSGSNYGAWFQNNSNAGYGVAGYVPATSGTSYGVYGQSNSPFGFGGYFIGRGYFSDNVGIGLGTTSPVRELHIEKSATSGVDVGLRIVNAGVGGKELSILAGNTGASGANIRFWDGTTNAMTLSDGNLGIGTTTPLHRLDVNGRMSLSNGVIQRGGAAITSTSDLGLYSQVDGNWIRLVTNGAPIRFFTDSDIGTNAVMTIEANGNVGIGTTSPGNKLHVQTGTDNAVHGLTSTGRGVFGWANAPFGTGVGVYGRSDSPDGTGVEGTTSATSGVTVGVAGVSASVDGRGVWGWASAWSNCGSVGVYGITSCATGFGVYSAGRFAATGTKAFQIDHPLDPANKYLNHYTTEGPQPLNAYSDNIVLDANGEAWVTLPAYFQEVNRDFRYQLTPVGAAAPNLHIAEEIQYNRFKIAGGRPGMKVSWRVEAVRNDRWVQQYGAPVEQEKANRHQGKYLHPELYGQPKEMSIHLDAVRDEGGKR